MEDLAMYLLDIANNAIRAMASLIEIVLINSEKRDLLLLSVLLWRWLSLQRMIRDLL